MAPLASAPVPFGLPVATPNLPDAPAPSVVTTAALYGAGARAARAARHSADDHSLGRADAEHSGAERPDDAAILDAPARPRRCAAAGRLDGGASPSAAPTDIDYSAIPRLVAGDLTLVPPFHAGAPGFGEEPPPFPAERRPRKSTISIFYLTARRRARRERRRLLPRPRRLMSSIPSVRGGGPGGFRDRRPFGGRSAPLFRCRRAGDAATAGAHAERLREQRLARRGRAGGQRCALFRRPLRRTSGPYPGRAGASEG